MKYIKPELEIFQMKPHQIICGSWDDIYVKRTTCYSDCKIWHTCQDRSCGTRCFDKINTHNFFD